MANSMAQMIASRGLDNVNLEMLSPEQRKELLKEVAVIYDRQGRREDAIVACRLAGLEVKPEVIEQITDAKLSSGNYKAAHDFLIKVGNLQMAQFVKSNFLNA
jgi:hypothetical protein